MTSSYRQFCPVAMAAEILSKRWTLLVLRELIAGSTRFNELRRGVPRMSPTLLSARLKELEASGILRILLDSAGPGQNEYSLTESGRDLAAVIESVGVWGQRWIEAHLSLDNLDPVDLFVTSDLRSMTAIWLGLSTVGKAVAEGKVYLDGDQAIASHMQQWLGLSHFAGEARRVD